MTPLPHTVSRRHASRSATIDAATVSPLPPNRRRGQRSLSSPTPFVDTADEQPGDHDDRRDQRVERDEQEELVAERGPEEREPPQTADDSEYAKKLRQKGGPDDQPSF